MINTCAQNVQFGDKLSFEKKLYISQYVTDVQRKP